MEKEFVPCNLVLELKELGFDEPCFRFKNNISNVFEQKIEGYDWNQVEKFVSIPTFSQAFRFFREKYNLHYIVYKNINIDGYDFCEITIDGIINKNTFKTYEEAELECLVKLIDIVKEQNVK